MSSSILGRLRSRPLVVYLALEAALALTMGVYGTVTAAYRVQAAGLNPLQLTLVGTALEGTIFLLQIPTGALADTFSRRASVALGIALVGAGFLLEGSSTRFVTILLAQALWGAGYTFISGAEEAWITDEIGVERANKGFLRAQQVGMVAGVIGAGISVALASLRLNLPLVVAGVATLALAAIAPLMMPESRRASRASHALGTDGTDGEALVEEAGRTIQGRMRDALVTGRTGLRLALGQPLILILLAIILFNGLASEGFDRLGDAHLLTDIGLPPLGPFKPVVWFGVLSVAILLAGLVATEVASRRVDVSSHRSMSRALAWLTFALTIAMVGFGLSGGFWMAAALYVMAHVIRRVTGPLYTAWLNQNADPNARATMLSLEGQSDALGQIAGGPAIGAIGLMASLPAALVVAGLALTPALALFAGMSRRSRDYVDTVDKRTAALVREPDGEMEPLPAEEV